MDSEPQLVVCPCQHCGGGIEFDAAQAGETVGCPHCGVDTVLTTPADAAPPPLQPQLPPPEPPKPQPVWHGSEASLVDIQLISGAVVKVKAVRLYNAGELNDIAAQKALAARLLEGVKSPYAPIGDPGWVVLVSKITEKIEQSKSRDAAARGFELIQKVAGREQAFRREGQFFHVGQVQEIEYPVPSLWTTVLDGSRFVHTEEDFITVKNLDGTIKRFRWSCVESYDYQANG